MCVASNPRCRQTASSKGGLCHVHPQTHGSDTGSGSSRGHSGQKADVRGRPSPSSTVSVSSRFLRGCSPGRGAAPTRVRSPGRDSETREGGALLPGAGGEGRTPASLRHCLPTHGSSRTFHTQPWPSPSPRHPQPPPTTLRSCRDFVPVCTPTRHQAPPPAPVSAYMACPPENVPRSAQGPRSPGRLPACRLVPAGIQAPGAWAPA